MPATLTGSRPVLWAIEVEAWQIWTSGIAAVLLAMAPFLVKVIPVISAFLKGRQEAKREAKTQDAKIQADVRAQVAREYEDIFQRQERQLAAAEKRIDLLYEEVRSANKASAECHVKVERLSGLIEILRARLDRYETSDSIHSLPTRAEAVIIADRHGIIRDINSPGCALLKWTKEMIVGQPIEALIPERWMEAHRRAWAKVATGVRPLRRGPYEVEARLHDGTNMPITLVLSSWNERDGPYYAAAITPRHVMAGGIDPETVDLSAMKCPPPKSDSAVMREIAAEKAVAATEVAASAAVAAVAAVAEGKQP